jgi:AraC-like DNA-binding protein
MNSKHYFDPHLVVKYVNLPPTGEWRPEISGWVLAHVTAGQVYSMHALKNQQLETGSVIAFPWSDRGYVRASQLDWASLHFFQVEPDRLPGLVTLGEQDILRGAAQRQNSPPRVFLADHPVSERFKKVCGFSKSNQFLMRLQLLQIFTEAMADELKAAQCDIDPVGETTTDARARMAELLKQLPTAALLELTLNELVKQVHCTPRHGSRIFNDVVGMSFRKKQSEVRLQRAQELLATTRRKVIDIAMESGYQSVSLFNLLFKRRFGLTPSKWREKVKTSETPRRRNQRLSIVNA